MFEPSKLRHKLKASVFNFARTLKVNNTIVVQTTLTTYNYLQTENVLTTKQFSSPIPRF